MPIERSEMMQNEEYVVSARKTKTSATSNSPNTFINNFAVGVMGGVFETSLLHWTNTAKNFSQQSLHIPRDLRILYRGYVANVANMASATAIQFAMEDQFKSLIGSTSSGAGIVAAVCPAIGAGAVSGLAVGPIELCMTQQQRYGGSAVFTVTNMVRSSSTMRGVAPAMVREAVYAGGYLGLCPVIESHLQTRQGMRHEYAAVCAAIIAGVTSSMASHPFDTIKTRIQGTPFETPSMTMRQASNGTWARTYAGFGWRCSRNVASFFVLACTKKFFCDDASCLVE